MLCEVRGLVIRTLDLADNDKLLTIFTEEYGKITAVANGGRALKSRYLAAAQLFCYGNYVLYQKGDRYWVREVNLIESFFDLRADLTRTALASYVCDVAGDVVEENAPEPQLLRLTLNTLYAIAKGVAEQEKIKAVFEMRAAALLGFCPMLEACATCGREAGGGFYLDVMNGCIACEECYHTATEEVIDPKANPDDNFRTARIICPLSPASLSAMRYAISSSMERLFSFRLEAADMQLFSAAAERYLLNQLERGFKSLAFYKQIVN